MILEPFKAEHLMRMRLQSGQAWAQHLLTAEYAAALEKTYAFSCIEGGVVLACGGVVELSEPRGLLWSYLDKAAGKHMLAIHRVVTRYLDITPFVRIEAEVDCEFEEGHRWVKLLGFELEAPRMRKHRPDGGDTSLYAKVK